MRGGRFNPVGFPALYLALSIEGMFIEMGHGLAHRFDPLTVCAYDVEIDDIVDLRDDTSRKANGIELRDMQCAWLDDVSRKRLPASWKIAETLIANGAAGILAPSFAHGARAEMTNLILWRWGATPPHRVTPYDPNGRLPRNQQSWS